jgi:hypothetical protein
MPGSRRTGRLILVAVLVLGGLAVGLAATGRAPAVKRAWETTASSAASLASSAASVVEAYASPSSEGDGGAAGSDAAAMPHRQSGPLSNAQLGAPLVHGTFVSACGAPDDMKVTVTVTVKFGRAVSVTVKTTPPDPAVASCIERAAREMQWDVSPRTDHVTVNY